MKALLTEYSAKKKRLLRIFWTFSEQLQRNSWKIIINCVRDGGHTEEYLPDGLRMIAKQTIMTGSHQEADARDIRKVQSKGVWLFIDTQR